MVTIKYCLEHNEMIYLRNKDNFCSKCGKKLVEAPRCKGCEEPILPFEKFCSRCGLSREEALV